MNLDFIKIKQHIVSCYMIEEGGKLFEGPGFKGYTDLVKLFSFAEKSEFKMVFASNVNESLEMYDAHHTTKRLNNTVIENKKIDITAGDICVSPTQIILNLTDFPVVCYNQYNFPTTLPRLENKALNDKFRGNIVLLTIHRLNNPKRVSDVTGNPKSYLQDLLDKNRSRAREPDSRFDNYMSVLQFANDSWEKLNYFDPDFNCNMITVVTAASIPGDVFRAQNRIGGSRDENRSVMLADHDLLFTKDPVFYPKENPSIGKYFDLAEFKSKIMAGSKFIYMIDRNNKKQDRWYYSHGTVELIPKITSGDLSLQADGLYFGQYDETVGIKIEAPIPLDEIDKLSFVYANKEEAEKGANRAEQRRQELNELEASLRERELLLQSQNFDKKEEYEKKLNDLRLENERIKNDFQREAHERELRFTELKRGTERENFTMKSYFDERKYEREDVSYQRESYIETLKTVAATAGVIATGFVIYKQFAKSNS